MDELFRMAEERWKQNRAISGWFAGARQIVGGRFAEALQACERRPLWPQTMPTSGPIYADAAGQGQGKIDGQPIALVNKALAIDPRNLEGPAAERVPGRSSKASLQRRKKTFLSPARWFGGNSGFAQIADNALADIKSRGAGTSGNGTATAAASSAPLATFATAVEP